LSAILASGSSPQSRIHISAKYMCLHHTDRQNEMQSHATDMLIKLDNDVGYAIDIEILAVRCWYPGYGYTVPIGGG
jgi:hypothetical protein